jgi:hypothetical protein
VDNCNIHQRLDQIECSGMQRLQFICDADNIRIGATEYVLHKNDDERIERYAMEKCIKLILQIYKF